jgi:hypothetical protein
VEAPVRKQTRRTLELLLLALLVLAVLGRLPSFSYVRVSGPDGTTVVEHTGPGPHTVMVVGKDVSFAKSGAW